jgi:hypothetical protein
MARSKNFTTRSSAIRAAKQACKAEFGSAFEAAEGSDFIIGADFIRDENLMARDRFYFQLVA